MLHNVLKKNTRELLVKHGYGSLEHFLITVGDLFLILNNGWFLVSTLATFECLIEKHKDKGVGVVGFLS